MKILSNFLWSKNLKLLYYTRELRGDEGHELSFLTRYLVRGVDHSCDRQGGSLSKKAFLSYFLSDYWLRIYLTLRSKMTPREVKPMVASTGLTCWMFWNTANQVFLKPRPSTWNEKRMLIAHQRLDLVSFYPKAAITKLFLRNYNKLDYHSTHCFTRWFRSIRHSFVHDPFCPKMSRIAHAKKCMKSI